MMLVRDGHIERAEFWRPGWSVVDVPWQEAARAFRERVDAAVQSHLISDVPTSVFLSGGLDLSVIAALASKHSPTIQSISVVFAERKFDEGHYSRLVAKHIGTLHHEVALGASELLRLLPHAFAAMDQPTFDGVNTFVVAAAARQANLKVSLSGLGADELLDGYGIARRARRLSDPRSGGYPARSAAACRRASSTRLVLTRRAQGMDGPAWGNRRGACPPALPVPARGSRAPSPVFRCRWHSRQGSRSQRSPVLSNVRLARHEDLHADAALGQRLHVHGE